MTDTPSAAEKPEATETAASNTTGPDSRENTLRRVPLLGGWLVKKFSRKPEVAVLRLSGVIGQGGPGNRNGLSLESLEENLEKAFGRPRLKAVALAINSPGGSPVQSALIAARIQQLAAEKKVPVLAFCEDVAASGGYWLACAGEEIYAQPASIIGSIGVVSAGFGFTGLIEKLGLERRVYAAGKSKVQLDPFQPEKPGEVKHLKALQGEIHEQFKDWVRSRRGVRLYGTETELFSGNFWTGAGAAEMGLVDGLGELRAVCREKFGDKLHFHEISRPKFWLQRKLGLDAVLASAAGGALSAVEERLWRDRFGV